MEGNKNDDVLDGDLLIDGDDDLLDYFLGNENADDMLGFKPNMGVPAMDEVNTGMEGLLRDRGLPQQGLAGQFMDELTISPGMNQYAPPAAYGAASTSTAGVGYMPHPEFGNNGAMPYAGGMPIPPLVGQPPPVAMPGGTMDPNSNKGGRGMYDTVDAGKGGGRGSGAAATTAKTKQTKAKSGGAGGAGSGGAGATAGRRKVSVKMEVGDDDSSSKPASGGAGSSGEPTVEETEEKRLRRLARNRESARQSRRRKKEHLETLEERVSQLTRELDELRRRHLEDANRNLQQRKLNMLENLMGVIARSNGAVPPNIKDDLMMVLEQAGPNSKERMAILDHHYKHLLNLLLPPYTKFLLWMMNQGESFFEDKRNGGGPNGEAAGTPPGGGGAEDSTGGRKKVESGLWSLVSNELGLTPDQQEKLKLNYKHHDIASTKKERERLSICTNYISKLRMNVATRAKTVETQNRALLDILTPEQSVKYMTWVEKNRVALDECGILDSVIFDNQHNQHMDPKFQAAKQVLLKPEAEMTLDDLKSLMAILDG